MRRRQLQILLLSLSVIVVSGCASMISGTNQSLSVSTTHCPGVTCQLKNSKGTWYVTAPGSVTVHRGYGDMTVMCKKEGFPDATAQVASSTKIATAANLGWGCFFLWEPESMRRRERRTITPPRLSSRWTAQRAFPKMGLRLALSEEIGLRILAKHNTRATLS